MTEHQQFIPSVQKQLARLKRYDEELSKVITDNFRINSPEDYPEIARQEIEGKNAQIELQKMLIDALEKINKELTDAQMEHEVKVGKLEDEVEKLKDEIDYWRGK